MLNPQDKYFGILHTSRKTGYSDNKTLIFYKLESSFVTDSFGEVRNHLSDNRPWLGFFSYDMKNSIEILPHDKPLHIETPPCWFGNFAEIEIYEDFKLDQAGYKLPDVISVKSNMTKPQYLSKVERIREYIKQGDIYQANLTRKFYGQFTEDIDGYKLYCLLNAASPSPYSAYLKIDDLHIISTSPELFIRVDKSGNAVTCPIKGSAAKGQGAELGKSGKDIAENLMITDLMRNDFSRACIPGSVKAEKLFAVDEFKTISHMHSVIEGKLDLSSSSNSSVRSLDLLRNCFPPGSMTGAPKIRAMEICSELEKHKRGIYSGVLGYFSPSADIVSEFSVVIRTLIIKGKKFEFQVGGGITFDSDAESEWHETMLKARHIAETLKIFDKIKQI